MFFLKQNLRLCYIFTYILGCFLTSPSLCAQVTTSKDSIDKLFDEVSLELTRSYFKINNLHFDETVSDENKLNIFLKKYFPNPNHNFRRSISSFYQLKENISISSTNSPDEIEYAIRQYFSFEYDSVKIKKIIEKYFKTQDKPSFKGKEERNHTLGSGTKPKANEENDKKQTQIFLPQDKKNGDDKVYYYVVAGLFFVLGLVAAIIIIKVKTFNNMVEPIKSGNKLKNNNTESQILPPSSSIGDVNLPLKSNTEGDIAIVNVSAKTRNEKFKNGPEISGNEDVNSKVTEDNYTEENKQSKNDKGTSELDSNKSEYLIETEVSSSQISEVSVVASTIAEITKENTPIPTEPIDEDAIFDNYWLILHTSQIGKSHLLADPKIPCQDNHAVLPIKSGWGVAVSCDGAGSAQNSYEGSKLVSQKAATYFKNAVEKNGWSDNANLPTEEDWKNISNSILKRIVIEVDEYGNEKGYSLKSLACTVIVIVYSPKGLLCSHIGDGRACYRDQNGRWNAIITPHKGDEANQTIFITSNWMVDGFKMSGKLVPECIVVKDTPTAFALMSDGCETHSFELGYFDKEKNKFFPENKPFVGFFEPIYRQLKSLKNEGLDLRSLNQSWGEFINKGNSGLAEEADDKTLIIGVVKAYGDSV